MEGLNSFSQNPFLQKDVQNQKPSWMGEEDIHRG